MTGRVFSKLLFSFVVALLVGMAVLEFSLSPIFEHSLRQRAEDSLADKARLLALELGRTGNGSDSLRQVARMGSTAAGAQVDIFDAQGRLLATSQTGRELETAPSLPELAAVLSRRQPLGRAERAGVLYVAVPANHLVVRLAYPMTEIGAAMRLLRRSIVLASLLSLLMATLLAAALTRRFARRLGRIVVFANRIASGDLSARVEEGDLDEISAVAHALDATASRLERSFQALESSRSQLTTLLDSMEEAVIAIDSHGQVSWCNAVMQRIAGTPVQEGRALAHSIRDPEVLFAATTALAEGRVCRGRSSSLAPGKTFEVNAAPMPGGGAVAVLHDVSEIERSETTRRDFVANVSHELRTPLTCISGYVETLLDSRGLSDQAREFLLIILKNASRMNRLTEDLLALATVESGDYKLNLRPMRASLLVEDAVASLAGLVRDSNLMLETCESTGDLVMADPDALDQVFGNLVENAIKYGKTGGRIQAGAVRRDSMVEFYVRDFGPGIAYEHIHRIFERFYRVDKARTHETGGTGLGLAIAKHIVQAHGGDMRCESELGAGATLLFRLPIVAPDAENTPQTGAGELAPAQIAEIPGLPHA